MGRRKVDRSDKSIRSFETTIPLDTRLKKLAFRRDTTVSALIRAILEEYFENIRDIQDDEKQS